MKNETEMMMLGPLLFALAVAGCGGSSNSNGNQPESPRGDQADDAHHQLHHDLAQHAAVGPGDVLGGDPRDQWPAFHR